MVTTDFSGSTNWLFNIAMENPQNKWRFRSLGKSSISMGHGFHGYVSHNQRGTSFWLFNIAIENGHRNSGFFPLKMVIFPSFFCRFTRGYLRKKMVPRTQGTTLPSH